MFGVTLLDISNLGYKASLVDLCRFLVGAFTSIKEFQEKASSIHSEKKAAMILSAGFQFNSHYYIELTYPTTATAYFLKEAMCTYFPMGADMVYFKKL